MTVASSIKTAEQLLAAGDIGRCELVRGELVMMSPAGHEHGRIAMRIGALISLHVDDNRLGAAYAAETGFILSRDPDTVRAPDVAFVRKERLGALDSRGFFPGPPDLAVEVLSPDDTASDVIEKVNDWLAAGCVEVWTVDPRKKKATIYRADHPIQSLTESAELTSEKLLPGFRVTLSEVFVT